MKFFKIFLVLLLPLLLLASLVFLTTGAHSYKVYVIHTGSMAPTIPPGSAVLVHEGHYRVGQVITFTEDGLTVTHRLVSISASGLTTTKGDGNETDDPWHVPTSQIVGSVVAAPRYVGYWITYFKNPLGLVSALFAFLVLWQVWSLTTDTAPEERIRRQPAHLRPRGTSPLVRALQGAYQNVASSIDAATAEIARLLHPRGAHLAGANASRGSAADVILT